MNNRMVVCILALALLLSAGCRRIVQYNNPQDKKVVSHQICGYASYGAYPLGGCYPFGTIVAAINANPNQAWRAAAFRDLGKLPVEVSYLERPKRLPDGARIDGVKLRAKAKPKSKAARGSRRHRVRY